LQLRPGVAGVLQIHVKPGYTEQLPRIADELRSALAVAGFSVMPADPRAFFEKLEGLTRTSWTGQKLDISTWQDEVSFLKWSFVALQTLSSLLIGVLLGVTVAGIMNSLWIATRERTKEIGTLRAIGMQRAAVARMFLFEATLLGLLAASLGAAFGFGIAAVINHAELHVPLSVQLFLMRDTLELALEPSRALLAISLMTFSAGAASLYPALRAARLKPASAMTPSG
jgi:ABC-type lipoprotein release transport system permease subunit